MSEPQSLQPKYGRRFIANAVLLAVVWTVAWVWFNAHVKPHISVALFSGVSVATLGVFCYGAFRSFVDTGAAQNVIRGWLRSTRMTPALLALLPLLAFAYLTTFTVYLNGSEKLDEVRLKIARNSSAPRDVVLSGTQKQRAVSYYFAFRPVTLHVDTQAPRGYRVYDVPLRRGFPLQVTVPDANYVKPFYLVRLVPLNDLFQLRGRDDPDMRYLVRIFVPGAARPIEHRGLAFRAIYLGASLADLKVQSKSAQTVIAGLRNRLRDVDPDMRLEDVDRIVAEWLDEPEYVATPELKAGDKVRVELDGPKGRTVTTVKVSLNLNDGFLTGEPE